MTDTIETRVARGVALLDEKLPGWRDRINLDILCVANNHCPLGQEFRDHPDVDLYERSPYEVGKAEVLAGKGNLVLAAFAHGFCASGKTGHQEYDALTAEWKRVILARREEASC